MRISAITNSYYSSNIFADKNKNIQNNQLSFEARFPNGMKKPRHVKEFLSYMSFARYNPISKNFGKYTIPVHNEGIGQKLLPQYNSESFQSLFDFAKGKGTFGYIMDSKTGFVRTSFINTKENPLMSDLIWITDTCNNMELVKKQNPADCTKVFNKLGDLYEGQQSNFDLIIENPSIYANNGFWPQETKGVGHCFVPQTHLPHKWFAKTRLESIGNYLSTFADLAATGMNKGKYGYKTATEVPQNIVDSISNSIAYLKSIHYPTARSCGAWEEQTFVNSLTSDTAVVNNGLRKVMDLMYSPTENKEILALRDRIFNTKYGEVFGEKNELIRLLQDGEKRISQQPFIETSKGTYSKKVQPWEEKCLERVDDAAMSFMPQTEHIVHGDIYKDSFQKLVGLKKLSDSLVRPNGAIRYKGDTYLNLDFHTVEKLKQPNKQKNEAEWFLVSEIANGYGSVVKQLLDHYAKTGQITDKGRKLLAIALKKQTEFINRSYARITPKGMTKSNGYSCPAYKVPEAYEAVTCKNGKIKYVPGAHPLTWAESSLHKASESFLSNLKRIEEFGLQ